ncbi:MAG: MFS transporter [Chloroflexi bacterium]|nr:MFS transporter [Anaerolineaceae bacterium]NMB87903.1 MFS transporter [Chloroflexota bacterium]
MKTQPSSNNSMARVMSRRDFRLLFAGAATSLLGDQFTIIATPWLVLKLTSDPVALGIVLALEGIPRAIFMLFGGAISDHLSPRRTMLIANLTRFFLTALMALLVFSGAVQLWMIYVFGLLFGIVAGFAIPAENSIVPMLVEEQDLQAGNSIIMGITQVAGFVGPTVAGILIGRFSESLTGVGLAFAIDALTFVASAITLQLIRAGKTAPASGAAGQESVWDSILAGVRYMWSDKTLRLMFLVLTTVNFLLIGPLMVGIPVLADQRLPEGAAAFGLLMSAFAGGNLVGYLLAGSLPRPDGTGMRWIMVLLIAAFGLVIGALGFIPSTWLDFGLLLLLGLGNGYIAILLITWMQTRTPQAMLGRMMSLLMLSSTGLVPISQALSGVLSKWNLTLLFAIPGALVLLVSSWMALQPDLKRLGAGLTAAPAEG